MAQSSLLITLTIVGVTCAIAVLLARRWQLHRLSSNLASVGWSVGCVAAYFFVLGAWPPLPWTAAALDAEPWESVVVPVVALCLIWPAIFERVKQWPSITLLVGLAFTCLPILAALCQTERFAAMFIGNTVWALSALLAVGVNWLALERVRASGAERWSLWILVGQSMTVAALIMTCYGRFGEWASLAGMSLGVVALARLCITQSETNWSSALALPALALNSVMIMHIREYRSQPLPAWLPVLPFLLPTIVAGVDMAWANRCRPFLRVFIAGLLTTLLAGAIVAIVLALDGPAEEW